MMSVPSTRPPLDRASPFEWVAALVRDRRNELVRMARREGVAAEDALDCIQDAIGTFLRRPESSSMAGDHDEAMRFLGVILRNEARNARRRLRRAGARQADDAALDGLEADARAPDERLDGERAQDALRRCLFELDDLPRAVVSLRMLEEWPTSEVAEALGLTATNVGVLLHRAKARLRGCMNAAGHCAESCLDD